MVILPAIDIRGQRVVRLTEGDFARETVYFDDPVEQARRFADAGLTWLHCVDLDGAQTGRPSNAAVIERIVTETLINVEIGGGIRSADVAAAWLDAGAARLIIGTAAFETPDLVDTLIAEHGPEAIAVAVDVREGRVATHGWTETTPRPLTQSVRDFAARGARWFLVTDIRRDGTLAGPNVALYEGLRAAVPEAQFIASGGIAALGDLDRIDRTGVAACVVGRALYEGRITVEQLACWHGA